MRPLSLKFGDLDLGRGSVKLGVMGSIRRTVNVIIALALAALGCGGFVYFYFIAAAWKGWTVISAVMGGVGLYWLFGRVPQLAFDRVPQPGPKKLNHASEVSVGSPRRSKVIRQQSGVTWTHH